jgi:pimeloyl-ACP methyl ester carboxylesterase
MSFSLNGVDEETGRFCRPDDFAANTVSAEIADLRGVCAFVRSGALAASGARSRRWGLLGHSRGGAVAILVAPEFEEVHAIVTWSTVARLDRYTPRRKVLWRKDGALVFMDERSDVPLRLNYGYYQDIESNGEHFDLPRAAAALTIPHLMVHGDHDGAVTPAEANLLAAMPRSGPARLEIIRGAGHTFNVRHPMHRPTPALERSIRLTTEWFSGTLGEPGKER